VNILILIVLYFGLAEIYDKLKEIKKEISELSRAQKNNSDS